MEVFFSIKGFLSTGAVFSFETAVLAINRLPANTILDETTEQCEAFLKRAHTDVG